MSEKKSVKKAPKKKPEIQKVTIDGIAYDLASIGSAGIELINNVKAVSNLLGQKELDISITKQAHQTLIDQLKIEAKTFSVVE